MIGLCSFCVIMKVCHISKTVLKYLHHCKNPESSSLVFHKEKPVPCVGLRVSPSCTLSQCQGLLEVFQPRRQIGFQFDSFPLVDLSSITKENRLFTPARSLTNASFLLEECAISLFSVALCFSHVSLVSPSGKQGIFTFFFSFFLHVALLSPQLPLFEVLFFVDF